MRTLGRIVFAACVFFVAMFGAVKMASREYREAFDTGALRGRLASIETDLEAANKDRAVLLRRIIQLQETLRAAGVPIPEGPGIVVIDSGTPTKPAGKGQPKPGPKNPGQPVPKPPENQPSPPLPSPPQPSPSPPGGICLPFIGCVG